MSQVFRKWLLVHGGIIAVALLVLAGTLWFLRASIDSRVESIRAKQTELAVRLRAASALAALTRERDEAAPFAERLESFLPPRDQLIAFSRDLDQLARVAGVSLGFGFGAETAPTPEAAGTIRFTITVGGGLSAIISFLEEIEKSPFIIRFEGVDITGTPNAYTLTSRGSILFR